MMRSTYFNHNKVSSTFNSSKGNPVSEQTRDNYLLELNKGYAKSAYENSILYGSGVTNTNPYNSRLTDYVDSEMVERNLSNMKRKTYTPPRAMRAKYKMNKEALYDIRCRPLNEQEIIGNYLPETLREKRFNKVFSSQQWAKDIDMMRAYGYNVPPCGADNSERFTANTENGFTVMDNAAGGKTMDEIYNSMLITTDTNIPHKLEIPIPDERLRMSEETYMRQFKNENNKIQDAIRLRNSPEKIERERRQRAADVNLKNEHILQLGRYDTTPTKFQDLNEIDEPELKIIDKQIREEFSTGASRKRPKNNEENPQRAKITGRDTIEDRDYLYEQKSEYYNDTPQLKKELYDKNRHIYMIKKGEILEVYPNDITNNAAKVFISADSISKRPIRTLASVDQTALYIIQKRDANDTFDQDGITWNDDFYVLKIPLEQLNEIWRKRVNNKLTTERKNEGVLSLNYEELSELAQFVEHNEDQGFRINLHQLHENNRGRNWYREILDDFESDRVFVMPEVLSVEREDKRQRLKRQLKNRGRPEVEDNYTPAPDEWVQISENEIAPIDENRKITFTPKTINKHERAEPFRRGYYFD